MDEKTTDQKIFIICFDFLVNQYHDAKFEIDQNFETCVVASVWWRSLVIFAEDELINLDESSVVYTEKIHNKIRKIFQKIEKSFVLKLLNKDHDEFVKFVLQFFASEYNFKNAVLFKRFISKKINYQKFKENFVPGIPTLDTKIEKDKFVEIRKIEEKNISH